MFFLWAAVFSGWYFSSWGRYDESRLQMEIPFVDQADIHAWNEGYSSSITCPWGFLHKGLDFFFNNGTSVLAMAPGQVRSMTFTENPANLDNVYFYNIGIRFNNSMELHYNFEPWTDDRSKAEVQIAMVKVNVGDWVTTGTVIADFLSYNASAHVDFSIDYLMQDSDRVCPQPHFSVMAYNKMMTLIHTYHTDWEMCYP